MPFRTTNFFILDTDLNCLVLVLVSKAFFHFTQKLAIFGHICTVSFTEIIVLSNTFCHFSYQVLLLLLVSLSGFWPDQAMLSAGLINWSFPPSLLVPFYAWVCPSPSTRSNAIPRMWDVYSASEKSFILSHALWLQANHLIIPHQIGLCWNFSTYHRILRPLALLCLLLSCTSDGHLYIDDRDTWNCRSGCLTLG